jgi:hypothetical protein
MSEVGTKDAWLTSPRSHTRPPRVQHREWRDRKRQRAHFTEFRETHVEHTQHITGVQ